MLDVTAPALCALAHIEALHLPGPKIPTISARGSAFLFLRLHGRYALHPLLLTVFPSLQCFLTDPTGDTRVIPAVVCFAHILSLNYDTTIFIPLSFSKPNQDSPETELH